MKNLPRKIIGLCETLWARTSQSSFSMFFDQMSSEGIWIMKHLRTKGTANRICLDMHILNVPLRRKPGSEVFSTNYTSVSFASQFLNKILNAPCSTWIHFHNVADNFDQSHNCKQNKLKFPLIIKSVSHF